MKYLSHIPLILLMLWSSAVSYATDSDVHGCHKIENNANKTVIHAGLTAQLLDSIDDDTRTKIQFAALVAAGPEIGISIVEAVTATRLLRTRHADKPYAVSSANDVRLALANKDLEGFDDAWDFVRTNPKGADAWELIILSINYVGGSTQFARDLKTLQKVADMMADGSVFRSKFAGNWQDELKDIIDKNKDLRCGACGNLGIARIPPMDEMLDNVNYILRHAEIDGFPTVWSNFKSDINDRDAVNHMIKYVKNNPTEFDDISAFEFQYADIYKNRADVMVGNIKYEFKSWTPGTANPWNSFFSGSGDSYTQFTRYLENSNSLAELKYIFNGSKASETVVKNAFKDLFDMKADDLFKPVADGGIGLEKMKQLFEINQITFNNSTQFKALLNNNQPFRNHVLSFLKSE